MRNRTIGKTICVIIAASSIVPTAQLFAAVKPEMGAAPNLPPIWQNVSARDRLNLVRAAELDASRLLVERIYGTQITSDTTVSDLAATDDKVAAEVRSFINGVKTVGEPVFTPDGRVEVIRKAHLDQVIKRIEERYTRSEGGPLASASNTTTEEREVVFDILGSAAIRGSDGHKRLMSKRAAEVDASRRVAERLGNVEIRSGTKLSNLAAESDEIKAYLTRVIKNAETTKIRFFPDNSAEVTIRVVMNPKVRVIARKFKDGEATIISDKTEEMKFEETGSGAPPADLDVQADVTIESVVEQAITEKGD